MTQNIINYLRFFGINQNSIDEMVRTEINNRGDYEVFFDGESGILCMPLNQEKTVPTLVAHLDTICDHRATGYDNYGLTIRDGYIELSERAKKQTYSHTYNQYTRTHNFFATPTVQCLGADDRSGVATVFAMLDELDKAGRTDLPIIMFCRDEEIGGKTTQFTRNIEELGFKLDTNLLIEIDTPNWSTDTFREFGFGSREGDPRLKKMLERFGYIKHQGVAVTDIASIGKTLDIPSISISASYEHEHTPHERLNIKKWSQNFDRLYQLYTKIDGKTFMAEYGYKYTGYIPVASYGLQEDWEDYYNMVYGMESDFLEEEEKGE